MDRIAIVSDIHGNMPALEAVIADIERRGIRTVYCLGDLAGKGPHPSEAVERIRGLCEIVIKGNWDEILSRPQESSVLRWHQERLSEEQKSYLGNLPFSYDFRMSGRRIRLFHASEESVFKRVQPWDSLDRRMGLFSHSDLTGGSGGPSPDVIGYGDIHNAFVHHFPGKVCFNTGSVGNPLEVNQASYAVLEGELGGVGTAPFGIQLVRVPYDIEFAIRLAEQEEMPETEQYAKELRTGRFRGLPPASE